MAGNGSIRVITGMIDGSGIRDRQKTITLVRTPFAGTRGPKRYIACP